MPNAAVWVCRCAKVGGTDWETVCNDLESAESLVQELSLSIESPDLQLWQALSRGALKKLTRQQAKRRRNERWKFQLATSGVLDSSEGIGRRSLRNRRQVNYANIDVEEEEEEEAIVADSDKSGDEEEAFEAKSDCDADSETDGDDDDDEEEDDQPRRSTRNSEARKRKSPSRSIRSSKRRRQSVRGLVWLLLHSGLRVHILFNSRTNSPTATPVCAAAVATVATLPQPRLLKTKTKTRTTTIRTRTEPLRVSSFFAVRLP